MGVLYADRSRIFVNGVEVIDTQSITVNFNDATKIVQTMTTDRRNKGVVMGNREITVDFEIAVQDKLSSAKIENIDYITNDVSMLFTQGADSYLLKGLYFGTGSQSTSGVGTEAKKTYHMLAMDMVDMVGNSGLFPTSLSDLV